MKMKIKILSLGCRLNQSEIESISTTLLDRGHEIVSGDYADIYIINSCSVTTRSERKTRQLIYQSLSKIGDSADGMVIVTGCASDIEENKRVIYLSNDYKYMIPNIIEHGTPHITAMSPNRFKYDVPLKCSTNRVNLKIQDGCNNLCSYCRIPFTRGESVCKSFKSVIDEFKLLLDNGFKEIILTGVNIGSYNDGGLDLANLVEGILKLDGEFRLHLTSLDPNSAPERLLDFFKEDKMVKHLHLSLQSGSDTILKRMNRPYNCSDYISVVEYLKSIDTDFNFTTDIIVGFPGETDVEFNETLSFIREVGFSHIHTFRFSPRPDTIAAEMDGIVPEITKTERSREIIKIYKEQKVNYYRKFSKRHGIFLSEKSHRGVTTGYSEHYIPVEINEKLPKNHFFKMEFIYNENKNVLNGNLL
jgi:threonylcarbamoyladenosine tRNA methylthiotransferase MtaB